MKSETPEEQFARLSALAAENGTSWDVEAAKEVSTLALGADWRRLVSERNMEHGNKAGGERQ